MKAVGMVRKIDDLGRIVLPAELRRVMGIGEKDPLEIYTEADKIILKKYEPACVFCGNTVDVQIYRGKMVCRECAEAVYEYTGAV
ncbi:MAG: AbrB/MazE/SpoVT family DNA-binding domain-containing protein [Desulfotomaculaceae bacterium]|nr:AbrB/MazE/SpoVT family DNA-binding domain-containing protein [Desulfotomaculaceae bacterium]